jgi:hypothetical protein
MQLAVGGRLVMPVGGRKQDQKLIRVLREPDGQFSRQTIGEVRFVPSLARKAGVWREALGGPHCPAVDEGSLASSGCSSPPLATAVTIKFRVCQ